MHTVARALLRSPPAGSLALALTLRSPPAGSLALALVGEAAVGGHVAQRARRRRKDRGQPLAQHLRRVGHRRRVGDATGQPLTHLADPERRFVREHCSELLR